MASRPRSKKKSSPRKVKRKPKPVRPMPISTVQNKFISSTDHSGVAVHESQSLTLPVVEHRGAPRGSLWRDLHAERGLGRSAGPEILRACHGAVHQAPITLAELNFLLMLHKVTVYDLTRKPKLAVSGNKCRPGPLNRRAGRYFSTDGSNGVQESVNCDL